MLRPTPEGSFKLSIFSLSIALGASLFSYNIVCLTQIGQLLQLKHQLNHEQFVFQLSIATSAYNLGAFISPLFHKRYIAAFGQLKGLMIIDLLGILCTIPQLIHLDFITLSISRFLLGILLGISFTTIPSYIASISSPGFVGKLGSYNQMLYIFGTFCSYLAGLMIIGQDRTDQLRWRIYLGVPIIFFLLRIFSLQLFFRYQSLGRLIQKNEISQLRRYCQMVYNNQSQQIVEAVINLKTLKKTSLKNEKTYKWRLVVALVVILSNQLTGVNGIIFYVKQLFSKIYEDPQIARFLIIGLSIVQLIACIINSRIADRFGRKFLILNGQVLIAICLLLIVLFNKVFSEYWSQEVCSISIVTLIFIHLFSMNLSLGPCCIVYCAQIVQDVRWMIMLLNGMALLMALTSLYMIEYIGFGYMFLIFLVLTVLSQLFLRFSMKETLGKDRAQIYQSFASTTKNKTETKKLLSNEQGQETQIK